MKERLTTHKVIGVFLGFIGAIMLIIYGSNTKVINAPNISFGNILLLINAISFGAYLVIVKPITKKYHTITLMKWMFLLGMIYTFPFTYNEFSQVSWSALPFEAIWRMSFVVIGTTFLTYMLNVYALKKLPPTVIGSLTYLQPLITIIYAVITGNDILDSVKFFACILVFIGVYLVSKKSSKVGLEE